MQVQLAHHCDINTGNSSVYMRTKINGNALEYNKIVKNGSYKIYLITHIDIEHI